MITRKSCTSPCPDSYLCTGDTLTYLTTREGPGKAAVETIKLVSLADTCSLAVFPRTSRYQAACVQFQHLACDFLAAVQTLCYQIPPASLMSAPTDLCLLANVSNSHCQPQRIIVQPHLGAKSPPFNCSGLHDGKV